MTKIPCLSNPWDCLQTTWLYRLLILFFFVASVGGRITAAIAANFFVTFSFAGVYLWSIELFPTVIRYSQLISICYMLMFRAQ
jgi:hypothetical protein